MSRSKFLTACVVAGMFRNAVVGDNAGGGGAEVSSGEAPATTTTTIIDTANIPRPLTELTDVNYFFKKDKLGNKRETVSLKIPYLTIDGLIEALQDEKQQAFILATVNDQIYNAGRWQVGDENKPVNKQDELDMSKMTLKFLAEMEPTERRGGGIAKEVWEAFGADYAAVMQPLTGKTQENIDNAVALLLKKFQPVKSSKKVVQFLKDQLSLWFQNTQNAEEFQECYEFLDKKAETLLQADEAALLASL